MSDERFKSEWEKRYEENYPEEVSNDEAGDSESADDAVRNFFASLSTDDYFNLITLHRNYLMVSGKRSTTNVFVPGIGDVPKAFVDYCVFINMGDIYEENGCFYVDILIYLPNGEEHTMTVKSKKSEEEALNNAWEYRNLFKHSV